MKHCEKSKQMKVTQESEIMRAHSNTVNLHATIILIFHKLSLLSIASSYLIFIFYINSFLVQNIFKFITISQKISLNVNIRFVVIEHCDVAVF